MSFAPDLAALDEAVVQSVLTAIAELPVAESSIYFGPTDDPRAQLPAVRILRGPLVGVGARGGREVGIDQPQIWTIAVASLAAGPYTVQVLGESFTFIAGPDPLEADVLAGVELALADCTTAVASVDGATITITANEAGAHLAVDTTANLTRGVSRDRRRFEVRQAHELTISFNFAAHLDPSSPSGTQHALARATLFAAGLWSSASREALRSVGVAPLRVASGPLPIDELVDAVAETRAVVEVVYSVQVRSSFERAIIETASATGSLES